MRPPAHQRGVSLIEALIAFLVLSLGMLGIAQWQTRLQRGADLAAQRAHALRLAQRAMEQWRTPLAADPASDSTADARGTRYWLERQAVAADAEGLQATAVGVHWIDDAGDAQQVVLPSAWGVAPAALSGALALQPSSAAALPVHGRSPAVPLQARDRGDGRSVLQPAAGGALALVFDNAGGHVVAVCSGASGPCTAVDGLLLAGWIRFSFAVPPDPVHPADAPLPLVVALQLTQGTLLAPGCITEPREGALAYHCAIVPAGGTWSGSSTVVSQGAAIDLAYRVCRYTGSGAHPDPYDHVDGPLMQQNFLVIRSDQACPVVPASPARPDGIVTVPQQP